MSFYNAAVMTAMQSLKQKVENSPRIPTTTVPSVTTTSVRPVTSTTIPSVTTTVPSNPTPTNLQPPTISGNPNIGETLRCEKGTWSTLPTYFEYAWYGDFGQSGSSQQRLLSSGETFNVSLSHDGTPSSVKYPQYAVSIEERQHHNESSWSSDLAILRHQKFQV